MCALLVSFLLGNTLVGSIDTLWTVDFSTQPPGWIAGPHWDYMADCIHLDIKCGGTSTGYYSQEDSLLSPDFVVPESSDSLVLVFDHYWWGQGCCTVPPPEWAQSTSTLEMYGPDVSSDPIELWEAYASCGYPPCLLESINYSVIDSGYVFIPLIDVSAGDTLSFVFRGLVESYTDYLYSQAYIGWSLYTFHILNYTEVSLECSTWGSIKTSF